LGYFRVCFVRNLLKIGRVTFLKVEVNVQDCVIDAFTGGIHRDEGEEMCGRRRRFQDGMAASPGREPQDGKGRLHLDFQRRVIAGFLATEELVRQAHPCSASATNGNPPSLPSSERSVAAPRPLPAGHGSPMCLNYPMRSTSQSCSLRCGVTGALHLLR
jgi:hypothetical protein